MTNPYPSDAGFDPDAPGTRGRLFGLPFTPDASRVVIVPVPWEATVSWGTGTADGPRAILEASAQIDLYDRETGRPYERGIAMLPIPDDLRHQSDRARALAEVVIAAGGVEADPGVAGTAGQVNDLCEGMNRWVYETCREWIQRDKLVGLIGGDHSVPFGLIQAVSEAHPDVGILHFDAHADLRDAYEGFTWSHASIFFNVLQRLPQVSRLVQVALRDVAPREEARIQESDRVTAFFDVDLRHRLQEGEPWAGIAREIVACLPSEVYLSFDIDGLDPALCPNTGTPVPGGLSFPEATSLMRAVAESGRRIVGFDLNEVAPGPDGNPWDGNVGARILYKMIGFALKSEEAGPAV